MKYAGSNSRAAHIPSSSGPIHPRSRRVRLSLAAWALLALALFSGAYVADQAVDTLHALTAIEAERDTWQRPSDVLAALEMAPGRVIADVGTGAGYFALKLAAGVGETGTVLATDIRLLPLSFLWIRAHQRHFGNVRVIQSGVADPELPSGGVDAVLIANTYHEFADPEPIIRAVFRSLKPDGRLVVLDRGPRSTDVVSPQIAAAHHELPPAIVERQLRGAGFVIARLEGRFIDRPEGDHLWWLLVATRP